MMTPIRRGGVLWVPDNSVNMPPKGNRNEHPKRPVVVVSGDATNTDPSFPIWLGCPISSAGYATEFDVKIAANEGGLPKAGWVRIALIQPFAKTDVLDRAGQFSANRMEEIITRLLDYTGALS